MPTGDTKCPWCGAWNPMQPHFCVNTPQPQITTPGYPYPNTNPVSPNIHEYGRHQFTPAPLTADDIRQIVREELERAKGDTR